jgi:hypothetical protein
LDTDVASLLHKGTLAGPLATRLIGREPLITFVTFGELAKWALTWSVRVQVMACGPPSMTTSCMSLIRPGSRWLLLVLVSGLRGG